MSVTLNHITFDCADAERVAGFWSSVLDEPVDDGASADFATITSRKAASWMFVKVPEGRPKTREEPASTSISARRRTSTPSSSASSGSARHASRTSTRVARVGRRWRIPKATSSASCSG